MLKGDALESKWYSLSIKYCFEGDNRQCREKSLRPGEIYQNGETPGGTEKIGRFDKCPVRLLEIIYSS